MQWLPDGQSVLFGGRVDEVRGVWHIHIASRDLTQLSDLDVTHVDISPDGSSIAAVVPVGDALDREIRRVDLTVSRQPAVRAAGLQPLTPVQQELEVDAIKSWTTAVIAGIRNPRAHEHGYLDDLVTALESLGMANDRLRMLSRTMTTMGVRHDFSCWISVFRLTQTDVPL